MTFPSSWFGAVPAATSAPATAGSFGTPTTLTIAGGLATKTVDTKNLLLAGAGGVADDLDRILGYSEGDMVIISPSDDAVTITVKDSVGMNLQGIDFPMDTINSSMILLNQGSDTWKELSRAAN